MSGTQNTPSSPQIFGFLCQQTNIFYAFETEEEYQTFIQWVQNEANQEN